ncbi:MAG: hypothetical protein ACRDO8_00625, partial [Nocardioidaceae bacterium]
MIFATVPLAGALLSGQANAGAAERGTPVHSGLSAGTAGPDTASPDTETTVEQTRVPKTPQPQKAAKTASESKAAPGDEVVAELDRTRTRDFGVVGLTWEPGFDATRATAQVRARVDGAWTAWQDLEIESTATGDTSGDRADARTGDSAARGGTAPTWVGEADGIAAR